MFKITNSPDNLHVATYQIATIEVIKMLKQQICSHIIELSDPTDLDCWLKTFTGCYIFADGTKKYFKNGQRHRDNDKPAVEWTDGSKQYFKNGQLHRDNDKPAIIWADGEKSYYKNGLLHRDNDKPAIIWADGTNSYFKDGKLHRDNDKPAIILTDGTKQYYKNGRFIKGVHANVET